MPDSSPLREDSASPWWRGGLRFSCRRCGGCCGREPGVVLFTDAEMAEMSGALGVGEGEFERLYVWRKYGLRSLRERANYDCVFLDGGGCVIYHARPAQCRRFPFWPEILKNKPSWDFYSRNCPGMDEGDLHDYEAIAGYLSKYEETGGGG